MSRPNEEILFIEESFLTLYGHCKTSHPVERWNDLEKANIYVQLLLEDEISGIEIMAGGLSCSPIVPFEDVLPDLELSEEYHAARYELYRVGMKRGDDGSASFTSCAIIDRHAKDE